MLVPTSKVTVPFVTSAGAACPVLIALATGACAAPSVEIDRVAHTKPHNVRCIQYSFTNEPLHRVMHDGEQEARQKVRVALPPIAGDNGLIATRGHASRWRCSTVEVLLPCGFC